RRAGARRPGQVRQLGVRGDDVPSDVAARGTLVRRAGVGALLELLEVRAAVTVEIERGVVRVLAVETGVLVLEPVGHAVEVVVRERREHGAGQRGPVLIQAAQQVDAGRGRYVAADRGHVGDAGDDVGVFPEIRR